MLPETVALVYEISPPPKPAPTNGSNGSNGASPEPDAGLNPVLINEGWIDERRRSAFYSYLQSGEASDNPLLGVVMSHERGILETSAYEVEPEAAWRRRSVAAYMTEAGVDFNCLTHASALPSGRRDVLTLHRHLGARPWSTRERSLLAVLFQTIAPRLGCALRPVGEPSIHDLPPRAIGVLDGFLRGLSSKQAAEERGISVNTVNEYAKMIHRHFGVQSRGELLAHLAGVSHRHQAESLFEA